MRRQLVMLGLLLCLGVAAAPAEAATGGEARIAELVLGSTAVHARPGGRVVRAMRPDTGYGTRVWLRVTAVQIDSTGGRWYKVLLPSRPNGSTGWIRADQAHTRWTRYRIAISTKTRRLQLTLGDRVVVTTGVVVGKRSTPTPSGQFAIYVRHSARNTPLAPLVMELTAHSNVLHEYSGGPGRIAIHGMQGSLRAPLGTARSHGCIRVPTRVLLRISSLVSLGTPVRITRHSLDWLSNHE